MSLIKPSALLMARVFKPEVTLLPNSSALSEFIEPRALRSVPMENERLKRASAKALGLRGLGLREDSGEGIFECACC
ncbi:hypothetical protein [Isorropodon fossajaponicum symbiont]|uniref:hypothetical protein n=1 Tax=Isorropodon fossajaponicum symbiont TaxID=883811 RepID=UPI001914ECA2|nr:hypothetical protein [Isorropodon fossajaponicum symbiont]